MTSYLHLTIAYIALISLIRYNPISPIDFNDKISVPLKNNQDPKRVLFCENHWDKYSGEV